MMNNSRKTLRDTLTHHVQFYKTEYRTGGIDVRDDLFTQWLIEITNHRRKIDLIKRI